MVDKIGAYSNPVHPEKSLEELQKLNRDLASRAQDRPVPKPASKRVRVTPEMESQLVARYRSGVLSPALQAEFGISKVKVLSILDRHGVQKKRTLPSEEVMATATELYVGGLTLKALETRLGFPASTLGLQLKKRGVLLRPRGGVRN